MTLGTLYIIKKKNIILVKTGKQSNHVLSPLQMGSSTGWNCLLSNCEDEEKAPHHSDLHKYYSLSIVRLV